jgi:hypothetical protein
VKRIVPRASPSQQVRSSHVFKLKAHAVSGQTQLPIANIAGSKGEESRADDVGSADVFAYSIGQPYCLIVLPSMSSLALFGFGVSTPPVLINGNIFASCYLRFRSERQQGTLSD